MPRHGRSHSAAVLVAVALATTSPVAAERPSDIARTRAIATAYADCVVGRYTAMAVDSVVNELPNDEISERYRRLNNVSCMGEARTGSVEGLGFGGDSFRYMLAEGLVRLHYASGGPTDFSSVPALVRTPVASLDEAALARMSARRQQELREAHGSAMGLRTMALLGECVARRNPETVRRIALTDPASPAESEAIALVQPTIGSCIPSGSTVRLNRAIVRGSLLLNYYRLAHAAQPPVLPPAAAR
jgi:hypothetical protein